MKIEIPKYPEYERGDSEWIGDVPTGWDVLPFKRLCKRVDVGIAEAATHAYATTGVPIVRGTNVRPHRIEGEILYIEPWFAEKNRSKYMRAGDLVTVRTGYPGVSAVIPQELDKSQCFTMIISTLKKGQIPEFFCYFFNSVCGMAHFAVEGWGSAQTNISVPTVQRIEVPWPPLQEQRSIVAFLDQETAKIDRLMEVRSKQVERLQEQRTAVIHRAVTIGLDPNAKVKQSGVEWLPQMPEGWTMKRLKYWAKHVSAQVSAMPDGHSYVALEHVESKTGRILPNESADFDSSVKLFKANDVLFGRLRPYLAKVALPDFDGVCVGELMVLRPNAYELRPRYLQLRLLTPDFISLVDGSTQGAKMPRANWTFVGNVPLAFPNPNEQDAIVAHIERETAKLDTLSVKYLRELELLAEYRASLISHAVTGKIDVRGLVTLSTTEAL